MTQQYYLNPETRDLIVFDNERDDIVVLQRISKVRIAMDGEFHLGGGMDGQPRGLVRSSPAKKGVRKCGKCGQPGHQARKCPN